MKLDPCIRVNYFTEDQTALLVDAIAPSVDLARQQFGPFPVGLRRHWWGGPHVLIGIAASESQRHDGVVGSLANILTRILAERFSPDPTFDRSKFAELCLRLREVEKWPNDDLAFHQDLTVDVGSHFVQAPLGDPDLAGFRDQFRAAAYALTIDVASKRQSSKLDALFMIAVHIMALEHLKWKNDYNIWPYSLIGQAQAVEEQLALAHGAFEQAVSSQAERFSQYVDQCGILRDHSASNCNMTSWTRKIQDIYNCLVTYAYSRDRNYFDSVNSFASNGEGVEFQTELNRRPYLFHPAHFAYRLIMNFYYELIQTCGFSPKERLFLCMVVRNYLTAEQPAILERTIALGLTMVKDGAIPQ